MNNATYSPLISNGELTLLSDKDIATQLNVSTSAYHCIYDYTIDSELITYLESIPVGGINTNTITNILTSAYSVLIQNNIISNLQISVIPVATSYITINVTCTDAQGEQIQFSWDNSNLEG